MRVTKFIFTVCTILLLVMFANGIYVLSHLDGGRLIPAPRPFYDYNEQISLKSKLWQPESSISEEKALNLLVLGLDSEGTRCDVIMLFNFELNLSRLNLLSIARDTRVLVGGRYTKINSLYSKGGENLVAEEVTAITGLPVHYYLTMDFTGFREMIDMLGGVSFYVPFRMSYDDPIQNLHIHLRKGMQLLDGKKAEQLVRYRKGNAKGQGYIEGDIGRIKMQQNFLKALIKQKINLKYISSVDKLFGILEEYVKTNISFTDITQYIVSIRKINSDEIKTFTLPGENRLIGGVWYFIYDLEETEKMIHNSLYK